MTTPPTETSPSGHELAYRPEIDGLRALAVLAVIAFHAGANGFAGGFAGVDVFFVVSGYLISGIIIRAIERGTFTFRDFYSRRANRIFPALILTLAGTLLLGWYLLFPSELVSLGRHIVAGSTFLSNFLLIQETGYFDVAAERKPLLHLWSLAIEEQFYLFWPLLLALSWKVRSRFPGPALTVGIGSFLFAMVTGPADPVGAFYLPFTRLWELVAGFCLFYLEVQNRSAPERRISDLMSVAGLSMIFVSIAFVNRSVTWPGIWTLLPVAGTWLVIAAGRAGWVNSNVLSNRALVGIGLISYPLYLWHWPLLSFARFVDPEDTSAILLTGAVLVSVVLAAATYRFVEFPIRSRPAGRGKRALVLLGGLAAAGIAGALVARGSIPVRLDSAEIRVVQEALSDWRFPGGGMKDGRLDESVIAGQRADTVLFAGDSHMEQYWPRVDSLVRFSGIARPTAIFTTVRACPMFPNVERVEVPECRDAYRAMMQRASMEGIRTVVLTSYWDDFFRRRLIFRSGDRNGTPLLLDEPGTDSLFAAFGDDLAALVRSGKRVFVVLTIPIGANNEFDPRSWLPRRLDPDRSVKVIPDISRADYTRRSEPVLGRVRRAALEAGAVVVDPMPYMCGPVVCPTIDRAGLPLYMDSRHLRSSIARSRAEWIDAALK